MKFTIIFASILGVTIGAKNSWTINEVSEALQNPSTNPALIPFLEHALNEMMDAIYAGYPADAVQVAVPVVSTWTLHQLTAALDDPATNPALIPYLEQALNDMMHALVTGQQMEAIAVVVPAAIAPVEAETPIMPVPVPSPVAIPSPLPVPSPVAIPSPLPVPSPVLVPSPLPTPSSPLVQIIVNVEQVSSAIEAPLVPSPVTVVEEADDNSFNPIDSILPGGVAISPIAVGPAIVGPIV